MYSARKDNSQTIHHYTENLLKHVIPV